MKRQRQRGDDCRMLTTTGVALRERCGKRVGGDMNLRALARRFGR
jgi:hypothetical protein